MPISIAGEVNRTAATICEFEWRIPDFELLSERCYFSPTFSFACAPWNMCISPHGAIGYAGCVSLVLGRNSLVPPLKLEVSFNIKTLDGTKNRECYEVEHHVTESGKEIYAALNYIVRTNLLRRRSMLLPSNALTVVCTVKLLESKEVENQSRSSMMSADVKRDTTCENCSHCKELVDAKEISSHQKKCLNKPIKCPDCSTVVALKNWYDHECQTQEAEGNPSTSASPSVLQENKVLHDLKELYIKKENCDVVMKVQEQEFQAHKLILEARSSVFASTFRNDMKEKATGVVDIEDCDPFSFSDFLCFVYCGDSGVISKENVFSLFTAADKYDIADLGVHCLEFMKKNLSVETFCDTMTVAVRHSETELIKLTTMFFVKNAVEIIKTVKWQSFLDENATVGNELFLKFASSSSSK